MLSTQLLRINVLYKYDKTSGSKKLHPLVLFRLFLFFSYQVFQAFAVENCIEYDDHENGKNGESEPARHAGNDEGQTAAQKDIVRAGLPENLRHDFAVEEMHKHAADSQPEVFEFWGVGFAAILKHRNDNDGAVLQNTLQNGERQILIGENSIRNGESDDAADEREEIKHLLECFVVCQRDNRHKDACQIAGIERVKLNGTFALHKK